MMAWKISGASGYEERALRALRFGLSLPAGASVTAASLTLTFDNWLEPAHDQRIGYIERGVEPARGSAGSGGRRHQLGHAPAVTR